MTMDTSTAAVGVREFKVAALSGNRNGFGLQGVILVARSGEAWEVGAGCMKRHAQGDVLRLDLQPDGSPDFARAGYEIPTRLKPDAPVGVVRELWKGACP
jgi:hypothetical protein